MNLQPRREVIAGQKEFLRNANDLQFKTAGATLAAADFPAGQYVKAGTAVYKGEDGLFHPWAADTPATAPAAGLTTHDVKVVSGQNPIVGVLAAGHPLERKCTGVNAAFKEATKGRLVFDI